jgi:hypothetical protein
MKRQLMRRWFYLISMTVLISAGSPSESSAQTAQATVQIPVRGELLFGGCSDNTTCHLWSLDGYTGQAQSLVSERYTIRFPTVTTDGELISYHYDAAGQLGHLENRIYDRSTGQSVVTLRDNDTSTITRPAGWSTDGTNILYIQRDNSDWDTTPHAFLLYNLVLSTSQEVGRMTVGETLEELPTMPGRQGFRIGSQNLGYEIERNPVYDTWIALLSDGTDTVYVPDPNDPDSRQRLTDVILWNYETGQMLSVANVIDGEVETSKPISWRQDGRDIAFHTSGDNYGLNIVRLHNPDGNASLEFLGRGDPDGSIDHWMGAGNLLITSEREYDTKDIVYYIAEIIDGEAFSTEFIRLPYSAFPSVGLIDWRITATEDEKRVLTCIFDQTLETRLEVGDQGRIAVAVASAGELRAAPGTDQEIIAQLPKGTPFEVVGAPWCANGYRWWQIRLDDGTVGYAAEADTEAYFLEPSS